MEFIVEEDEGLRLDRWLAERLDGRTRNQVQHDLEAGRVRVNDVVQPARYTVTRGDRVDYETPPPPETRMVPQDIPLDILFEDEHVLVLNKPAGMVVHPAPGHRDGTLANALLAHCGPSLLGVGGEGRWGIIHRLDGLTSGLMVAAKTPAAYTKLVEMLADRRIRRKYLGIVIGSFKESEGIIEGAIGRRSGERKLMGIVGRGGRPARTDWRLLAQGQGLALLAMALHSGRTHQIRVHMQSIGHSVLGDPEYGWSKARTLQEMAQSLRPRLAGVWPARQMLHASILMLEHPVQEGRLLRFECQPPADMLAVMNTVWGEEGWKPALDAWLSR